MHVHRGIITGVIIIAEEFISCSRALWGEGVKERTSDKGHSFKVLSLANLE